MKTEGLKKDDSKLSSELGRPKMLRPKNLQTVDTSSVFFRPKTLFKTFYVALKESKIGEDPATIVDQFSAY